MAYKIHPGIGVACIGNSPTDWHIAPETSEVSPIPPGGYRDAEDRVKPLGARFRVFEYDDVTGDLIREVGTATGHEITWEVNLRETLPGISMQPPEELSTITGPNRVRDASPRAAADGGALRELRTDTEGRLIVLGRFGSVWGGGCDGWVHAQVRLGAALPVAATASWVTIVSPDFAPGRRPIVSFYDLLYQKYVARSLFGLSADPVPSFTRDIFPLLRANNRGRVLDDESGFPSMASQLERRTAAGIDPTLVPAVTDELVSQYTAVQFRMLKRWVTGVVGVDWIDDWAGGAEPAPPAAPTPAQLDRGPLSHRMGVSAGSADIGTTALGSAALAGASIYAEPFRFAADPPFGQLVPGIAWHDDLGSGCPALESWASTYEYPYAAIDSGFGGANWRTRGFMVLQPEVRDVGGTVFEDSLSYVESVDDPFVLRLTQSLDFGAVAQGPGGARGIRSLPIVFEVLTGATNVVLQLNGGLPGGLTIAQTMEIVPAGQTRTVKFWLTYDTSLVTSPLSGVVTISGPDSLLYQVPVRGTTRAPEATKIAFVLDVSASMAGNRGDGLSKLQGLKDAFGVLLDASLAGTGIGVASFSDDAIEPFQDVIALGPPEPPTDPAREQVRTYVNGLVLQNLTSIGDGLTAARGLLDDAAGTYAHEAVVVITDGKETAPAFIDDVAGAINARTFAVGIGRGTDVDVSTLQNLTGNYGGYLLLTGDPLSYDNRFTLEKHLTQIVAGIRNDELIVDPEASLLAGTVDRIAIPVTEAELSLEATVICDEPERLAVALQTPSGEVLAPAQLSVLPGASFVRGRRVVVCRVELPLVLASSVAQDGEWALLLALTKGPNDRFTDERWQQQLLSRAAVEPRAAPLRYAAVVSSRSALRMQVDVRQPSDKPGSPILIEAFLTAFGGPLVRDAKLSAEVVGPGGLTLRVDLDEVEAGRFLGQVDAIKPGDYQVRLRALGRSPKGARFQRELVATASVSAAQPSTGTNGNACGCRPPRGEDGAVRQRPSLRKWGKRCLSEFLRKLSKL